MELNKRFVIWFRWGSNPGPFACEANVITTTLRNLDINNCKIHNYKLASMIMT